MTLHQLRNIDREEVSNSRRSKEGCLGLAAVREFFDEHGDALINVCDLLGGAAARNRALEIASAMADSNALPCSVERMLADIERLLSAREIDHLDQGRVRLLDIFSEETAVVENISLLTGALSALLRDLGEIRERHS